MKKLLLTIALCLLPSLAFAQCNGVFPNNTACGNTSGAPAPPSAQAIANFSIPVAVVIPNASPTGTQLNHLAKLTGNPSKAIITATADVSGAVGIVSANAGTTGNAVIVIAGNVNCAFDGLTTAGDYIQISSLVAGDCHDAGATLPSTGQVIGIVLSTNVSPGTYAVILFSQSSGGTLSGSGITGQIAIFTGTQTLSGVVALPPAINLQNSGPWNLSSGYNAQVVRSVNNTGTVGQFSTPTSAFGPPWSAIIYNAGNTNATSGYQYNFLNGVGGATINMSSSIVIEPADAMFMLSAVSATDWAGIGIPSSLFGKLAGGSLSVPGVLDAIWFDPVFAPPTAVNYLFLNNAGAVLVLNAGSQFSNEFQIATGNVGRVNIDSTAATFTVPLKFATSITSTAVQTYTNSPCLNTNTAKWIPVQITGQSGTWYVPACQ